MFGYSSDLTAAFGAVIISGLMTLLLRALSLSLNIPRPCLIGFGVAPLVIYSALYVWLPHPPYGISLSAQTMLMVAFVCPNL
jgi:hypothetical protein